MAFLEKDISVTELFKIYSYDILSYAASLLKDKDDAKDALQEVFVKFINSQNTFRGECSYKTWLLTITRNYCFSKLRQKSKKTEELVESFLVDDTANIDTNISFQDAMKKLSDDENELFYLKEYAGYSYKEISEILEMNVNTVKTKLFKIRRKLKDFLK
jgi:RNA polymerase sigma-70 factor, ECF subfamily